MPHTHHAAFESLSVSAALILLVLIYVRGWVRIRRLEQEAIEVWRATSFLIGLFVIWAAVASPFSGWDHDLLTAHMVKHLLLMTFAAPLIWLGVPVKALLLGLPRKFVAAVILPRLRWRPVQKLGRTLAHPAVCWLAAAGTLVAWHIPAVFMLGLQSEKWHAIEQASFLLTGLLFWWPVVRPWPSSKKPEWLIVVYLFLATLPCDILSGFLVFCDRVVYPVYFSSSHPFGLSALQDQQCAAALMWTCVTVVYLIPGAVITARLLSPQGARQHWIPQPDLRPSTASQTARQTMEVL